LARDHIASHVGLALPNLPDLKVLSVISKLDNAIQNLTVPSLRPEEIGHFEEYEDFPVATWKKEVEDDDTRMGYHEWADYAEAVRDEQEYDVETKAYEEGV
jgi:hypothetical protein|tara:strand:- start:39 stop:341 length:303 start_codon:yes stop_codon:yes gene_type:complete